MSTEMNSDKVLTSNIAAAYLGHNTLSMQQVPELISSIYNSLQNLGTSNPVKETEPQKPAVSIRKSYNKDEIICLECGERLKILKRHLRTAHNISTDEYKTKWGLPADYPVVAPSYSAQRSKFAKDIGLGNKAAVARGRRGRS